MGYRDLLTLLNVQYEHLFNQFDVLKHYFDVAILCVPVKRPHVFENTNSFVKLGKSLLLNFVADMVASRLECIHFVFI